MMKETLFPYMLECFVIDKADVSGRAGRGRPRRTCNTFLDADVLQKGQVYS